VEDGVAPGHLPGEGLGATDVAHDGDGAEILEELLAPATPNEANHVVAAALQCGDEGTAERARRAGDEYAHEEELRWEEPLRRGSYSDALHGLFATAREPNLTPLVAGVTDLT